MKWFWIVLILLVLVAVFIVLKRAGFTFNPSSTKNGTREGDVCTFQVRGGGAYNPNIPAPLIDVQGIIRDGKCEYGPNTFLPG